MNVFGLISITLYILAAVLAITVFGLVWWQALIVIIVSGAAGSYAALSNNR